MLFLVVATNIVGEKIRIKNFGDPVVSSSKDFLVMLEGSFRKMFSFYFRLFFLEFWLTLS